MYNNENINNIIGVTSVQNDANGNKVATITNSQTGERTNVILTNAVDTFDFNLGGIRGELSVNGQGNVAIVPNSLISNGQSIQTTNNWTQVSSANPNTWHHNELELNPNDVMVSSRSTSTPTSSPLPTSPGYSNYNNQGIQSNWNLVKNYDRTLNGSAWSLDSISRGQTPLTEEQINANAALPMVNNVQTTGNEHQVKYHVQADGFISGIYVDGKYVDGTNLFGQNNENTLGYINYSEGQSHLANGTSFVLSDGTVMQVVSDAQGQQHITTNNGNLLVQEESSYRPTVSQRYGSVAANEVPVANVEFDVDQYGRIKNFTRNGKSTTFTQNLYSSGEQKTILNQNTPQEASYGFYLGSDGKVKIAADGATVNATIHYADGTTEKVTETSNFSNQNYSNLISNNSGNNYSSIGGTATTIASTTPQFNHLIELQKNKNGDPIALVVDGKTYNGVRKDAGRSGGKDITTFTTYTDDGTSISYYRDANGVHIQSEKNNIIVQETVDGNLVSEYRTMPKTEGNNGEWKNGGIPSPEFNLSGNTISTNPIKSTLPVEEKNRILGFDNTTSNNINANGIVKIGNVKVDSNGNRVAEIINTQTGESTKVTLKNDVDTFDFSVGGVSGEVSVNGKGNVDFVPKTVTTANGNTITPTTSGKIVKDSVKISSYTKNKDGSYTVTLQNREGETKTTIVGDVNGETLETEEIEFKNGTKASVGLANDNGKNKLLVHNEGFVDINEKNIDKNSITETHEKTQGFKQDGVKLNKAERNSDGTLNITATNSDGQTKVFSNVKSGDTLKFDNGTTFTTIGTVGQDGKEHLTPNVINSAIIPVATNPTTTKNTSTSNVVSKTGNIGGSLSEKIDQITNVNVTNVKEASASALSAGSLAINAINNNNSSASSQTIKANGNNTPTGLTSNNQNNSTQTTENKASNEQTKKVDNEKAQSTGTTNNNNVPKTKPSGMSEAEWQKLQGKDSHVNAVNKNNSNVEEKDSRYGNAVTGTTPADDKKNPSTTAAQTNAQSATTPLWTASAPKANATTGRYTAPVYPTRPTSTTATTVAPTTAAQTKAQSATTPLWTASAPRANATTGRYTAPVYPTRPTSTTAATVASTTVSQTKTTGYGVVPPQYQPKTNSSSRR